MKRDNRAFSLIELLIVVAIILIIAAIAIPNLMRSRIAANQASAVQSLRMVHSAQVTYSSTYNVGFAASLLALGPPAGGGSPTVSAAGLLDSVLAGATKSGYTFSYTPLIPDPNGNFQGYTIIANPVTPGTTGSTYYFSDQTFVIRGNNTAVASSADSPVAQ